MGTFPSATDFTSRTPIQFICAAAPSLSITKSQNTLYNNPKKMYIHSGNVAKIDLGLNGTSYIMGDGEFAPFAIDLVWDQLGYNDYLNLAALKQYNLTFISFRNNGYYGKLYLEGPVSDGAKVSDVVSVKGTFYVLAPSDDGSSNTVNRIATPTTLVVTNSGSAAGGYIPGSNINYYWLTYSSIWGETVPQAVGPIQSGTSSAPSSAPTTTTFAGGTIAARTGYAKITYVYPSGETTASPEATQAIALNNLLQVNSPANPGGAAIGWNVYTATTSGSEKLQNGTVIPFNTNWQEPTSGMTATGVAPPSVATAHFENTKNTITFSWPSTTSYCIKASIYCANVNDPTKSLLVAELLNGDSPAWTDLVGFGGLVVSQQPPTASTAYRGLWQSAIWLNETP